MEPLVRDWFASKFKGLTEPQAYAVPLIHDGKSVLVSSPTGSGKTLTAFLAIILSTPKFREHFANVEWVILDEIHEVCSSKRGSLLSICLERLREQTGRDFVRIGLSATIAPIEEEAKFLAGYANGKVRDMHIVEVDTRKSLDLAVLCPVRDMTAVPMEVANARMYDVPSDLIDQHRTTLIFTNTRSGTEHVSFEPWDLMECATLAKAAYDGRIDRVDIPGNPLDVLAQALVAMSLEKRWDVDEAYELVRRSYSFHDLPKKDFLAVLDYLSSRNPDIKVFAKIWFDEEEGRIGKKKGTRMIYYTNVGTIPEEGTYHVFSERGSPLGEVSEKFVEYLSPSDIFVLGGRTDQFVRARGTSVYVKDASGRRPTVPSWTGEMLPRSFDLSIAVGEFRRDLAAKIAKDGEEPAKEWLMEEYRVDAGSAQSLVSYTMEQEALIPSLPTDRQVLLEGYLDVKGNRNVIFHFPFGRRVNDALSRAYAFAITEAHHTNVRVSVTDDNFMITVPRRIELTGLAKLVTSENLEDYLRRAIRTTELFKQRFRHCAKRSFMILRNYKGREVSIERQQLRCQRALHRHHQIEDFTEVM